MNILIIPEMNIIGVPSLIMVAFLLEKTVDLINCNRNTIEHIPHVGLCLFTDVLLLILKVFMHLRKSYLRITMGQKSLSSVASIYLYIMYFSR